MALTQRQMACFENNPQFQNEVAAALLPIAAEMKKAAMVTLSDPASSEVQQTFAGIRGRVADQILAEQGVNVAVLTGGSYTTATGGSIGMKYVVRQMLMQPDWTLTPDAWAADEMAARAEIQAAMGALLTQLTAIPGEEPETPQAMTMTTKRGKAK